MKRAFCVFLCLLSLAAAGATAQDPTEVDATPAGPSFHGRPTETSLERAGSSTIDLRNLPDVRPRRRFRPEREAPPINRGELPGGFPESAAPSVPGRSAPAPSTLSNFLGLDFANWGAGRPPDTVGDVGPDYYIQAVNTSIGIYRKSDSVRVAAFTFDTFMSQGNFGNLCDTDNFGDPVILYDTFEDRWVITDFAFQLDGGNNVVTPPGAYQCFAVSKTGDPVSGGWNYYSLHITDALNDYPKLGIWPDGIYMSANMFGFPASGTFQGARVWALNKAQMYAGAPTIQVVQFSPPPAEFTLLPANARLQTGTPPAGTPNYFSVVWQFTNVVSLYKFHVDWNSISLSTFTGPFLVIAPASWGAPPDTVPAQGGNANDTLAVRLMMQNQYSKIGGVESLWNTHTVLGGAASTAAPRYYQTTVTGGTVAATTAQAATHTPDTSVNRYMPSLAVDRAGDMALGYSASSSTLMPAIRYAGRLSTDPVNTLPQTETSLVAGTGAQNTSNRWGDYSAMSLDPDGCTFWYTNEYYITTGGNWQTRVGSFKFPSCSPVTTGSVQGTVTATVGGAAISGATVTFGSRTATTDVAGFYSFAAIPSGTYPGITASAPGYNSSTATNIVVTDGATTTQSFSLGTAPTSACPTDTTQADFQTGVPTNVDLVASPGNVILLNAANLDQHADDNGFGSGYGFTSTALLGQTFTAGVTGTLTQVDASIFCAGCSGANPNITLEVRSTSGGQPVMTAGGLLATATIAGTSSGSGGFLTFNYATPPTLTAGTQYGIVMRLVSNRATGTQAWLSSNGDVMTGGRRVLCTTAACSNPTGANNNSDLIFKAYVKTGFAPAGNLVSSLKDSNPPVGFTTTWSTLSWNATTPANTTLRFQVAGSTSATGPFNFVGPDGTAATFFTTSGASLSQFNGKRYLQYKAYLSTTVSTATPTVADVTVCYAAVNPPDLSLTKSDGGVSVAPGGTVAYTLTYANVGSGGATGVVLTDTVPANTIFNAGVSTAGWNCAPNNNAGSTCTLAIGALAGASGNQTATFAVTVVNPVAAGVSLISNTAAIADNGASGADPTPANNSGSDTTPVIAAPDLSITKSDGGASVAPGGTVAYTLTYANGGNQGATGVVLTETVPANATFNPGSSTAGWVCAPNGNAGSTCTLAVGGVVAGGGSAATFAVTAASPLPAGLTQISNTASIADDGANGTDPTPGNNSGSDTTPVTGAPDLSITKSDGGASAAPGGTVSYTLTYANAGNRGATGVVLTETVPANATFNAGASTAGWVCSPNNNAGSACTLAIGALAAGGGSQNATFAVTVTDPLPAGVTQISNAASIADDGANGTDPTPGNNSGSDTTPVTGAPDLSITKSDGGASVAPGGTVSYTLTYANGGNRGASGVVLTETVPANSTFNSGSSTAGWVCAPNNNAGSTCTLAIGALAAGGGNQNATFAVTVTDPLPAGVTQISNTASIADDSANGTDPAPGNNSGSDTTPVTGAPDLSITKSDGGASVAPGGTVSYTLMYANGGNRGASGVVLTETVPANATFNAGASTAGWACSPNNNAGSTCTLAIGALAAGGGNQNATFAVTVTDPLPAGVTQISNTASIADDGANGTDPTPGNNSGSDTTPVTGAPDLSITKSDGGASVAPGGTVSYTLMYANGGNRGASGVVLTETVPANSTFNSGSSTAGWVCAPNNNAGSTCTLAIGALAAGGGNQNATFAVTVTDPLPAGVTQISNTASIADDSANGTDPTPGNNSGSDTTPVTGAPDLSITKSDGGASVAPGGTVSYTLTYANGGNRGATGVVLTETVPANATFNSGSSTAGWVCSPNNNAGSTCTLAIGALAAGGGNQNATFAVTVTDPLPAGVSQISNTASIADDGANGTDPTPGNNSGSDTTPVTGAADLSITKSDGGASVAPGGTATYTLTYSNSGNRGASGVVLTETVPANATFNSGASTAGWICAPDGNAGSTCTLAAGSLAAGSGDQTATFAVTVVNPVGAGVTQISNTASIADDGANGTDPTPGNNSGSDTTPLTGAPDLSLSKSDGGASVAPGGTVSYTLTYANGGDRGASGVVLTETVPANATFNSGASTAGWVCAPDSNAGSSCTLAIGALAAGGGDQTATFAVTVIDPVAAGVTQISNTASIADDGANGTDPAPGNNSGSDTTPVTAAPDLTLGKSDGGASVAPGGTVSYTLTYANGGDRGATGVVLTETVPANTTFNSGASTAGWACAPDDNAGSTCTLAIGALAAGGGDQTATFAVTAGDPLAAGVQISNTASIADDGANGTDPTPGDNSGSDTTPVTGAPDLSLAKSDGGALVEPGGTVSYTLTFANSGNRGASGVVLTETVPANTTFDSGASTAGWVCAPDGTAGSTCTLAIGALVAGGGDQTATFAVTVDDPRPDGVTEISNTASIADDGANGTDPTPGGNSATDTTPVVGLDFYTIVPCRLMDSRIGGVRIVSGAETTVAVGGQCAIPADATAVALNVTVIDPSNAGFLVLYPIAGQRPLASIVNFVTGQVRPNNAIVHVAPDGSLQAWFLVLGGGTSHLAVDAVGYFK